ncbi:unnamed protein product [Rotaria sordida]|uniref:Uncharacterized protein n=1 Tax=Rotaria sordida TaxID=392033 RepID=A0A819DJL7_9BILA|nr:unnamed protein product [Rotaria sordida]CAF3839435.1 unnamed protein product [Rotaria sordida]
MDNWLANDIDNEIEIGREKRHQYNSSRRTIRKQVLNVNQFTMLPNHNNTSDEDYNSVNHSESMDIDITDYRTIHEPYISTTSNNPSINNIHKSFTSKKSNDSFINNTYISKQLCEHIVFDDIDDEKKEEEVEEEQEEEDDDFDILNAYEDFINAETSSDDDEQQQQQQQNEVKDTTVHRYTNMKTSDVCKQLVSLFRRSQISKSETQRFISFIQNILPVPNTFPNTMIELLTKLNIEPRFDKRIICSLCKRTLDAKTQKCLSCSDFEKRDVIFIYDTHFTAILTSIITRLGKDIEDYKKKIWSNDNKDNNETYDIPFASTYRVLLNKHNKNFISLLFHLDGIRLCKSTKLKLWIFSASIIELPPPLRYRRHNMPLISIFVGCKEPKMTMWLGGSIRMLKILKQNGMFNVITYLRDPQSLEVYAKKAEDTDRKVFGHKGRSILGEILDVPFPISIICDYQHVSLLRHFRDVVKAISSSLSPDIRQQIDGKLRRQTFPHFFNRKMRGIEDFSFIKASELRNLVLYGFLPLFYTVLPVDQIAHMSLFICGIRLLHGSREKFGDLTHSLAGKLFKTYYEHHSNYYSFLNNYVLHLHMHYSMNYQRHGALTYVNTFAQENLIGYIAANRNGELKFVYSTRCLGDLIMYYYNIDMYLCDNALSSPKSFLSDDPLDLVLDDIYYNKETILEHHARSCCCNLPINICIKFYQRCNINGYTFHSLSYNKKGLSNSYVVQYLNDTYNNNSYFGEVVVFFQDRFNTYALIKQYAIKHLFSDYFKGSKYYKIIHEPIDAFFFEVVPQEQYICLLTKHILKHCVVFRYDNCKSVIVTPISSYEEHD